ncbi:MAG: hypothetical protein LBR26_12970 [Prevotella sp.]|jgi:hypothetical protein|nr:hypothetical protein [Prevotella sp.]
MKFVVLYGLITSVFLSFASCRNTDDEFLPDDVLPPVPEGYVRMQITVPGLTPVSTYALTDANEMNVSTVDVLVFGHSDQKLICKAAVTEPAKITGSNVKTFDVDLGATDGLTGVDVVVIANANTEVSAAGYAVGTTLLSNVKTALTFSSSGKWPVDGTKSFPMWGEKTGVDLSTNTIGSINLIRSMARIDVGVNFNGETAQALSPTFVLKEISLYNSLDKGLIASGIASPSIPSSTANGVITYTYNDANGFSNNLSCTKTIYMAEQLAEHASGDPLLRPFLIVKGNYNGESDSYYRIDFVDSGGAPQPVLRNHRYKFNITTVKGSGYGSADLAKAATPFNITTTLTATNAANETLASYVYDGQYALGVSKDSYTFDKGGKSNNSLKISTTYTNYEVKLVPDTDTWLTFVSGGGTGGPTGELTFNVAANTGGERNTKIVITSGRLTKEVTVVQTNKVGFEVTGIPVTDPTYSSGLGSSKTWTVTSSYNWCVNVSDSHGIIQTFLPKGSSSTTSFTFTPLASTYYAKTEATFTFFSPTGEFVPVTKTISVPATSSQYLPSGHGGWAGSNIYWTGSYLTFDDTNNRTNESYQGVFFQWGSLIGLDPSYTSQGSTSWGSSCKVYVPNWNYSNPTSSTWTATTAGSTYTWSNIPRADGQTSENKTAFAYLTMDAGATATANTSVGGHVPVKGKSVANQKMIGDICRYLTETGRAPGSTTGTRWRMPTAAEFASPTTASPAIAATTDYNRVGTFSGSNGLTTLVNDATGKWKVTNSSTNPGRRKQYSHIWTAGASAEPFKLAAGDQPFFPATGYRCYNYAGVLGDVGYLGRYYSSSPGGSPAYTLYFLSNSVSVIAGNDRNHAFPVRCVKEL